jgi:hypothetical protein
LPIRLKWEVPEANQDHLYLPGGGALADRFLETLVDVTNKRGVEVKATVEKFKDTYWPNRFVPCVRIQMVEKDPRIAEAPYALVTAKKIGPDLSLSCIVYPGMARSILNAMEISDMHALGSYTKLVVELTLAQLDSSITAE